MKTLCRFYSFLFTIIAAFCFIRESFSAGPDSLKYIGHASVKIKTSDGKITYIDPYAGTTADYTDPADIVLITHQHIDHNQLGLVTQKTTCTVISNTQAIIDGVYQTFTVGTIKIDAVAACNAYHLKSETVGYVIEFNGIKIYHAGDTSKIDEMAEMAARGISYALLPMDGFHNMGPEEAMQCTSLIQAQYYIPIHTMPPPDSYSDAIAARFTAASRLIIHPGESIELTGGNTSAYNTYDNPSDFFLEQNYPNPFNSSTRIEYTIPKSEYVILKVFNVLGQEIATLVNSLHQAGNYTIAWLANDFPSGVYFYRIEAGGFIASKKLLLIR